MNTLKKAKIYTNWDRQERRGGRESKIAAFYTIMNALKGNRNMHCDGTFTDSIAGQINISVDDNDRYMWFQYGNDEEFDPEGIRGPVEGFTTYYHLPPNTAERLDLINSLIFIVQEIVSTISLQPLKYALVKCPHLTSLVVDCVRSDHKLTAAGLEGVVQAQQSFKRNKDRIIKTTSEYLIHVTLKGTLLNIDLLTLMLTYLPDIESLSRLARHDYGIDDEVFNSSELDLTGLRHLKYFYMDIGNLFNAQLAFVQFTYPDSGVKEYYRVKKLTARKIKNRSLYRFKPTTLQTIFELLEKYTTPKLDIALMKFKCNRIRKFILGEEEEIIAEFNFGVKNTVHL